MAKFRFNTPSNKAAQNDRAIKMFGNGADGNVIISTNQTISRDMYYNNLTVNNGITLFTNGFKIFVKGTLENNGTVGMPSGTSQTTSVLAGSVMTRDDGTAGYDSADAIDGSIASIASIDDFDSLIYGVRQTGLQIRRWYPGSKGADGADGADGTDGTANPGSAGSGGGSGSGNAGTAGTKGSKGTAGTFGQSGGSVVIVANNIIGSGTFVSQGTSGTSGTSGGSGNPGVAGNAGTTIAAAPFHNPGGHNPGGHNPGGHNPSGVNPHSDTGSGATANPHTDTGAGGHPGNTFTFSNPNHQHPHTVPGNPGHNAGRHVAAHHRPARNSPPKVSAAHDPAHFTPGNPFHNASHHTHKGHSHPKSNPPVANYHAPGNHNANTHVAGNPHPGNPHPGNPHPGNPGHNPDYPGGAGGTANPGNAGNPGTSGNPGAPGTLVVFTRNISSHIANSNVTIIKDIDS